nr:Chain A, LEU-GLY-GLN-GLN-GLN-ALA-PHE-PRO-PRO-GLN-GLN-PRO-TYR [Homo sapiens]
LGQQQAFPPQQPY